MKKSVSSYLKDYLMLLVLVACVWAAAWSAPALPASWWISS